MNYTDNFNFKKPEGTDFYNVGDFNDNSDAIDAALKQIYDRKGAAGYFASLDSNGRIPFSQLPESAMEYKGLWNAATNTPTLTQGVGTNGDFYIVSTAGTWDGIVFGVDDRIIYDSSLGEWHRLGAAHIVDSLTSTSTDSALSANQGRVLKGITDGKEDQMGQVSRSGSVTIVLDDNTVYTLAGVTTLNITGANVSCMGTVVFGASTPSVTVSGFTAMDGDDITGAAANEVWEFNVLNGRCLWKKWG